MHDVLILTIEAYQAMRRAGIAKRDWEENTFTVCLGDDYLRDLAYDNEYSIYITIRDKIHTPQMKQGKQPTIEAKEMDLSLYGSWERDYIKKRFVWEAKRIGDKRVDKRYTKLYSEYVHEAIYRFINREYASGLDDAGVLGYVLAGQVSNIVTDINSTMGRVRKNKPLSRSNHLAHSAPINGFQDKYHSHHTRTDKTIINLYHLFLTFDFN